MIVLHTDAQFEAAHAWLLRQPAGRRREEALNRWRLIVLAERFWRN